MTLSPNRRLARWLCLLALAMAGAAAAQPVAWELRGGATSGWLVRGVLLSAPDKPVLQAEADLYTGAGWSAGVGAYAMHDLREQPTRAAAARVGHSWTLSPRWRLFASLQRTAFQRGSTLHGWGGWQTSLGVADRDDFSFTWNEDRTELPLFDDRSADLMLRRPLGTGLSLVAGAGRVWGRAHRPYAYGQLGLQGRLAGVQWQLQRCDAEPAVRRAYGANARGRWVAAVQAAF